MRYQMGYALADLASENESIIALDEVDTLNKTTLKDIIYLLKDFGKTGIVCISNTRKYVLTLDPRVMSRFIFIIQQFKIYFRI